MTNWDPTSAKAQLRATIQRLGQLQVKKDANAAITRKDISTLLQQGNVALARSKAQKLIHEDSLADSLEVLEQQVGTLLDRFSELEQRSPPSSILLEASSNIIFAAPRLQIQELGTVSDLISQRLEPDVLRSTREHRNTYVSPKVLQGVFRPTPTAAHVDAYLEEVAKTYGMSWRAGSQRQDLVNPLSEILDPQSTSSIDMKQLQSLCAQGIPDEPSWLRPRLWKLFMGILPTNKAVWKIDIAKQRDAYYDLVRRLLRPFTELSSSILPISGPDETLIKVYKHLAHIPKELMDQLDSEPEDFTTCPLHQNADEKVRISFANCLDIRSQQLRRLNEDDQEGTTISSTPEIRLEGDVYMTPTTSTKPDALSDDCNAPTTLLSSKSIALGRASQKHASALLRLLYIHASINPGNLSPYVPSLLLPLYTALAQEVDHEDLAHVEADSFWLFEAFVAEFAELEDETSLEIWLKRLGDRLRQKDPQLLEQLNDIGLHPSSPHYSSRWLSSLLTHTLPLSAINPVWDVILCHPSRERGKHPRLDSLTEICTAMVIAIKPLLFKQQKTSGLWEEPSDGFLEGLAILQSYPVELLGGIDTVLQLLTVDLGPPQPANGDLKKSQPGLGSRIKVTMWKGFTNQVDSPEESDEESDGVIWDDSDEEVDDGNDTETPNKDLQSNSLTSRIANTVWRGITNQSSMEPPPSPVIDSSPQMSSTSPVLESSSSSNQPQETPSSSTNLWAYTEKLKGSDTVAALSKISSNWRAKAMLSPWSRPKESPSPDLPQGSKSAVTSPVQKKFEPEFKRSSLPVYDHTGAVYSPPPRPGMFRNPRDSFVPAEAAPLTLSPTEISLNERTHDSGKSSGSLLERTRNLQSSLMSLTRGQNTPSPSTTPKGAPRPLLLNSSSLITSHSSGKSRVTPPSGGGSEEWADATAFRKPQLHRDSMSSISSLSPSDAISRKQTRSDYDSDTSTSRIVPLNRRSISPMALASKTYMSRPSSSASTASSEQTVPATPAKIASSDHERRDTVDVVFPNDEEVSPNGKADLPIFSERVTLTRKTLRRKPHPTVSSSGDTSDSSAGGMDSRAARLRSKHHPTRLSHLHMNSPSQAENSKSTSPSNLEVPWPSDDEETATTPRASTFDSSAMNPSSPSRSPINKVERFRKTSNNSRHRKLSNTSKEAVRRSRSYSAAEDGDDEGYDDLLSAYESEENSSAA